MKENELISVVVPVYNVEQYIAKCIDSIIAQTYYNIEIMLVDDGSPDNSGEICDEYATKDSRIKVFHMPNGGVGKARQFGVEKSSGEYVTFVDADDFISVDCVQNLYDALTPEVDIVRGSFSYYYETTNSFVPRVLKDAIYDKQQYINCVLKRTFVHAPWGNLYRKNLFTDDSFPNTKRVQDLLMNVNLACKARKVKSIPDVIYYYRDDSVTTSRHSYNHDYEFGYGLCQTIYDTLNRYDCYEYARKEFAVKSLSLLPCIHIDAKIDASKDPLIVEINSILRDEKIGIKLRSKLLLLNNRTLRGIARILRLIMLLKKYK